MAEELKKQLEILNKETIDKLQLLIDKNTIGLKVIVSKKINLSDFILIEDKNSPAKGTSYMRLTDFVEDTRIPENKR